MRTTLIVLSLLLVCGSAFAEEATEVELTDVPPGLTETAVNMPVPPRATFEDDTLVVYSSFYDDMELDGDSLVATGAVKADPEANNVAQARAMAEKTAQYAARNVLVEFFTALGFSSADAQTNAGNAKPSGTDYFDDGSVEYHMSLNLGGEGGLAEALGADKVVER